MAYKIVNKYLTGATLRLKSPYTMDPQYITIHNTANDAPASNEIAYMTRNSSQVGYHVAIDDVEAIQAIPFNRNAFHAGDGKDGTGNRKSIGIEICYSKSGGARYMAAEENAIEYVAHVLKQYGWGIDRVKWHRDWSGKNCPHRIFAEGRATSVRNRIAAKLAELKKGKDVATVPNKPTNTPSPSHKTGWEWAEKKGYMNGERPKEGLTREQFASVMMKIVTDLEKRKG